MEYSDTLLPATFVRRDNRFRVTAELQGRLIAAHLPNSGRLGELLMPEARLWLRPAAAPTARRTEYDLLLSEHAGTLVSVDARLPNVLLHEALRDSAVPSLAGYGLVRREVRRGASRLDFLLENGGHRCWVETKSVTLVECGVARFPDAPTRRGLRHVRDLGELAAAGERAVVVFVVQRADSSRFAPHATADPAFTSALREAHKLGVEVVAYGCQVSLTRIFLDVALPVTLDPARLDAS